MCLVVQLAQHLWTPYIILRLKSSLTSMFWIFSFSKNRPLGWLFHRVAMWVYIYICLYIFLFVCPLFMSTFSMPLIGPQVTWSDPGLSLVNAPPPPKKRHFCLPYAGFFSVYFLNMFLLFSNKKITIKIKFSAKVLFKEVFFLSESNNINKLD